MTDIIFLTLPRLELRCPITAPAILKASVEQNGYTAFCYDLNLSLWHNVDTSTHGHVWFDTDLTFRYEDKFVKFWEEVILPVTPIWCNTIKEKSPTWIGLTIFSQRSKWISIMICKLIREKFPHIKIVAGGPFAEHTGPLLFDRNLVDAYVVGEGEQAIIDVLSGNLSAPGINGTSPKQIADLDTLPIPDYSDFDFSNYPKTWSDPRVRDLSKLGSDFVYITGSRGCVRKCEFCDIESVWPKYRYRSGKNIAEEMRIQNTKYGSRRFLFTDSLLNGSVKQLTELCETLIEYTESGKMNRVVWQGQFIARSEQQMPESVYILMKQAGCFFVSIGVESGSQKVRDDMNKMFDDAALDFTFTMCAKHNIEMAWLLMVGYPTEDDKEFQLTLDMLIKYQWINEQKMIRSIALGPTLDIVPGSPLHRNQKELGITWDDDNNWVYKDNTRKTRILNWLKLKDMCTTLGYPVVEKATDHLLAELEKYTGSALTINTPTIHFTKVIGAMGPSHE